MGSGGGTQTSTAKTSLPGYLQNYSKLLTGEAANLYGSGVPQQQTAPFTNAQLQAQQQAAQLSEPGSATNQALTTAQNANTAIASGANLNPATNPALDAYINAGMQPLVQQYEWATAPNILQNAVGSGGFGSSGT